MEKSVQSSMPDSSLPLADWSDEEYVMAEAPQEDHELTLQVMNQLSFVFVLVFV
jgi:hypothetical protein